MKTQTPKKFIASQYLWSGFKDRIEPYLTDKKCAATLTAYTLPRSMSDSEIQNTQKSTPIDASEFASVVQNFCDTADKSKFYILHVQTPKEVLAVHLSWVDDDGVWCLGDCDFDDIFPWHQGYVFLFLATANSEALVYSDTDDTLTLENAIKLLKSNGYQVAKIL